MNNPNKASLETVNNELLEASEKLRFRIKLESSRTNLSKILVEQIETSHLLEKDLGKEQREYHRLQGLSLHALFYQIFGDKAGQLKKEKQEYLAALLRFQQCETGIGNLKKELSGIEKELEAFSSAKEDYQAVLKKKEALLLSSSHSYCRELLANSELQANQVGEIKETGEAIDAGLNCLEELKYVIHSLERAGSWGTWDMIGGGMLSSAIKHGKIDDARHAMARAQHHLLLFNKELNDIGHPEEVFISSSGLTKFADIFFDNIITDWVVQSRINQTLENAVNFHRRIQDIVQKLQLRYRELLSKQEELKKERQNLIETA